MTTMTMAPPKRTQKFNFTSSVVRSEVVFVTPSLAVEMLTRNARNRKLTPGHVDEFEALLRRGEMCLNGSTIGFDTSGNLLNGQHRLNAVVNTGIGFWVVVVTGLEGEVFDTIDTTVRPRQVGEILALEGTENAMLKTAMARALYAFAVTGEFAPTNKKLLRGFTAARARGILTRNPEMHEMASEVHSVSIWRTAVCGAVATVFHKVSPQLAGRFLDVLRHGGERDTPFHRLREWMITETTQRGRGRTLNHRVTAAKAIKAWNLELHGETVRRLVWGLGDNYPQVEGLDYTTLPSFVEG